MNFALRRKKPAKKTRKKLFLKRGQHIKNMSLKKVPVLFSKQDLTNFTLIQKCNLKWRSFCTKKVSPLMNQNLVKKSGLQKADLFHAELSEWLKPDLEKQKRKGDEKSTYDPYVNIFGRQDFWATVPPIAIQEPKGRVDKSINAKWFGPDKPDELQKLNAIVNTLQPKKEGVSNVWKHQGKRRN